MSELRNFPRDPSAAQRGDERQTGAGDPGKWTPGWFAAALGVLWLSHLIFLIFIVPRFMAAAAQLGIALPLAARLVIGYSQVMTQTFIPFGGFVQAALMGGILGIHYMLRQYPAMQRLYGWGVCLTIVLCLLYGWVSLYSALYNLPGIVR